MKLSFCIPTYARARELRDLLASLLDFAGNNEDKLALEVCISVNFFEDHTHEIIKEFQEKDVSVEWRVEYQKEFVSAQSNILKALNLATGDYIWLIGSDDKLIGKACEIKRVLSNADPRYLVIVNRLCCDKNLLEAISDNYFGDSILTNTDFPISSEGGMREFFSHARTVDALGCFISSLIFSRALLEDFLKFSCKNKVFYNNLFPHVYSIWSLVRRGVITGISYEPAPLVAWRGQNSSCLYDWVVKCRDLLRVSALFSRESPLVCEMMKKLIINHYGNSIKEGKILTSKDPLLVKLELCIRLKLLKSFWRILYRSAISPFRMC